jgi:lactobin A/cerein 7B family class IIb bacteriocin
MNMLIAEKKNTDLGSLTDNELDDVNGGFVWLGVAAILLVEAGIGYLAGKYMLNQFDRLHR